MILSRVRSSIDKLMISNLQNECARVAKFHLVIGTWVHSFQFTCQSLTLLLLEMTNSSHAKTFDNTFQYTHASMIRFVFMYLEEKKMVRMYILIRKEHMLAIAAENFSISSLMWKSQLVRKEMLNVQINFMFIN